MAVIQAIYAPPRSAPPELVHRAWELYKRATVVFQDERRRARRRLAQRVRTLYLRLKQRALLQATRHAQQLLEGQLLALAAQWQGNQKQLRDELIDAASLVIREIVAIDVQHPHALKARVDALLQDHHAESSPRLIFHPEDCKTMRANFPTLFTAYEECEDASLPRGSVGVRVSGGMLVISWQAHLERLLAGMREQLVGPLVSQLE